MALRVSEGMQNSWLLHELSVRISLTVLSLPPLPSSSPPPSPSLSKVREFVQKIAALAKPDSIHVCNGSQEEFDTLMRGLITAG